MIDTATLLTLLPKKALVAAYNDQTGRTVPHGQALFNDPVDLGTGLTQITLSIRPPLSNYEVLPYIGEDTFTYQRLNLADLGTLIADDMQTFAPPLPTTTATIVAELQTRYGIVSDENDFIIEEITADSNGFSLRAAPTSLRWYGSLALMWGDVLRTVENQPILTEDGQLLQAG